MDKSRNGHGSNISKEETDQELKGEKKEQKNAEKQYADIQKKIDDISKEGWSAKI